MTAIKYNTGGFIGVSSLLADPNKTKEILNDSLLVEDETLASQELEDSLLKEEKKENQFLTDLKNLPGELVESFSLDPSVLKERVENQYKNVDVATSVAKGLVLKNLGLSADAQKDIAATAANQVRNAQRTINYLVHRNKLPEEEQKKLDDNLKEQSKELYDSLIKGVGQVTSVTEPVFDVNTGRLINTRTALTGVLSELAAPIGAAVVASPTGPVGMALAGSAAYYATANPEENLTNMLVDLGFEEGEEFMDDMLHLITSEELSKEDSDRAKLLIEEVALIGIGPALVKGTKIAKGLNSAVMEYAAPIIDGLKKPYEALSDKEKSEVIFNSLRSAGLQVKNQAVREEGIFAPFANTAAAIRRVGRHYFTSSGLSPKLLYDKRQDLNHFVRSSVSKASQLTTKLDGMLEELAGKSSTSSAKNRELIQSALTEGLKDTPTSTIGVLGTDHVKRLLRRNRKYDALPDDLLDVVVEARSTVDNLSSELHKSLELNFNLGSKKALKDKIQDNMNQYLTTSYRIHQEGWKVDKKLYAETVKIFTARALKENPEIGHALAKQKAEDEIDTVLGAQRKFLGQNNLDFKVFNNINTTELNQKTLKDPAVKRLFGEIRDPSENFLVTVSNLSKLVADAKYHDEVFDVGTQSKYKFIFSEDELRNKNIYSSKIEGTNSRLDGTFTTPEILLTLQNREAALMPIYGVLRSKTSAEKPGIFTAPGMHPLVANIAEVKGLTQKMKTVWSLQTHARNAIGGSLMSAAQGVFPFTKQNGKIFKALSLKNEKEFLDFQNKLLDLGVINTSPRLAEYRELLTEYKKLTNADVDGVLAAEGISKISSKLSKKIGIGKLNLDNLDETLSKFYMGTDDFFKTHVFLKEKDVLKKAYPDLAEDVLDREAAKITKNVMPNYDRITPGAKAVRQIPAFGAFIGFSAEVIRTGAKTFQQATKELLSGNKTLAQRGASRLASYSILAGAGTVATENLSAKLVGWSEKQTEALKTFYSGLYGEDSFIFVADEEGQIDKIQTTHTDPWNILKEPYREAAQARVEGQITEEEQTDIELNALGSFVKSLVSPFVSETVANQAIVDFTFTLTTGNRLSGPGFIKDIPGEPNDPKDYPERIEAAFINLVFDLGPNIFKEAKEFSDIIVTEEAVGRLPEPKDKEDYLFKRFTTLPRTRVNMLNDLGGRVRSYQYHYRKDSSIPGIRNVNSYEGLVEKYRSANKKLVEAAQELYIDLNAVENFYSDTIENRTLATNVIDDFANESTQVYSIARQGIAPTIMLDNNAVLRLYDQTAALRREGKLPNSYAEFETKMEQFAIDIALPLEERDLNKGVQSLDEQSILPRSRLFKAVGGEIDTIGAEVLVPNTPIEPDGRIDKMTGLPYNVQAGIPFIDEQDPLKRLGLVGGGKITSDPIQRLGFVGGGQIGKAIESGVKTSKEVIDTVSTVTTDVADNLVNAFKYVIDIADEEVPQVSKNLEAPTVYHQSDAEFDTFSIEKIGTGQGNQAEGHGIFLSSEENPGTFYGKNQYKATLNLAEDEMLDYDLPLKDQSEYVKNALLKIDDDPALSRIVSQATLGLQNTMKELIEGGRTTGESLTNSFRTELRGADKVSELFNKLGIKATKYVTKEIGRQGTKSYVVFDPSVLKITSKTATKQLAKGGLV